MKRLLQFFISAGKWGIGLMTGGAAAYLVAAYEHIAGHSLTAFVWDSTRTQAPEEPPLLLRRLTTAIAQQRAPEAADVWFATRPALLGTGGRPAHSVCGLHVPVATATVDSVRERDLKAVQEILETRGGFGHREHLELAWSYLRRYSIDEATEVMVAAIRHIARKSASTSR